MEVIQKGFKLTNDEYYKFHLNVLNAVLSVKLTEKELDVLAAFMSLDKKIIQDDIFNLMARKKVRELLNLSSAGLGNYLKSLINKGFLIKNEITNKITIIDILLPDENKQGYMFKIIKIKN